MRCWLGIMLMPDGDVPLFNDCVPVGHERLAALEPTPPEAQHLHILEPSGYVVARSDGRMHLVADVGLPCPDELPAHAHADCLSFQLAVDRRRVITEAGTWTYEPGPIRAYERSTRAHRTVEIGHADQTEVWGAFRAGHRARRELQLTTVSGDRIEIRGSHAGYSRLPGRPKHRRTWTLDKGEPHTLDEIEGKLHLGVRMPMRLQLLPDTDLRAEPDGWKASPFRIQISGPASITYKIIEGGAWIATGFAGRQPAKVLEARYKGPLPICLHTAFQYRTFNTK